MAKQTRSSGTRVTKKPAEPQDGLFEYTTASGMAIPLSGISLIALERAEAGIEEDMRDEGARLDPPTYEVEVLGGDTLTYELDGDSLEAEGDPEETARRKREWHEYQAAKAELRKRQDDVRNEMIFDSIMLALPEDDGWMEKQRRYHIRIPEDLESRRRHWIETEVLKSIEDMVGMISYILAKSASGDIELEDVEAAKKSFRDLLSASLQEGGKGGGGEDTARTAGAEGETKVGA